MAKEYRIYPIKFNTELWRDTMRSIGEADLEVFAAVIGVAKGTLHSWRNLKESDAAPYPQMTNFIAACNALDLNPQHFFILEVPEG